MKNYIVTGASRGVGLEIATLLLKKGCCVFAINRSITDELLLLKNLYPKALHVLSFDLANVEDLKVKVFSEFIPLKTPIHGFVNNAAIAYDDIVTNLNVEKLEAMFTVNVFAPMLFTKYVIRNMLFNRVEGSIIHISSISVHTGYKGLAMYAASKGALEAFSKNTAREWGEKKIRSNCIVAGFMETSMSDSLSDDQKSRIYNRTSLKTATSLASVANTVCFILDDCSGSITGQNIFVDSGTI
jgi:3-oxoacyl-[acyl-carrier protein] reductase